MSEETKLKIEIARLQGEYTGTLKGILFWDIPSKLKERLEKLIIKLENQNKDETSYLMSTSAANKKRLIESIKKDEQ